MSDMRIDIVIGARNEMQKGFASAERALQGFRSKLNALSGGNASGGLANLGFGALTVEAARKLVAALTEAASKATDLATRYRLGEVGLKEMAEQGARSLPIIGSVAVMFDKLSEAANEFSTGEGAALIRWQRENEAWHARLAARLAQQVEAEKKFAAAMTDVEGVLTRAARGGMDDASRKIAELRSEYAKLVDALVGSGRRGPELDAALEKLYGAQYSEIDRIIAERQAAQRKDAEQAAREAEQRNREEVENLERVQGELRIRKLELLDDELGAERARIAEHFKWRLQEARSEAEREALLRLQQLELAAVGVDRGGGRHSMAATMLSERFAGLAAQRDIQDAEQAAQRQERMIGVLTGILKTGSETNRKLDDIRNRPGIETHELRIF